MKSFLLRGKKPETSAFKRKCAPTHTHTHTSPDIPEVLEGCVDVKVPAVHISNVGSGQFHLRNRQTGFIILENTNTKMENYRFNAN